MIDLPDNDDTVTWAVIMTSIMDSIEELHPGSTGLVLELAQAKVEEMQREYEEGLS